MDKEAILKRIVESYLKSSDFNGIPTISIQNEFELTNSELKAVLSELLKEEKLYIAFPSVFMNPHIRAFDSPEPEKQIEILEKEGIEQTCLYPLRNVLGPIVGDNYQDAPYTREMKLGEPELVPIYFNLDVLEKYYQDPRYYFKFEDYTGHIYIRDKYYESDEVAEVDKTHLQTFGLGYSEKGERIVVVFRYYLSCLTPEHQRYWKLYERKDKCKISEPYYRNNIIGEWVDSVSNYRAFIEEQVVINKMAEAMGKPTLFRNTFEKNRPKEFSGFLRPTLKNFNSFIQELDKMLSENINRVFFRDEIPLEREEDREDGKIVVIQKGTLTLLYEYLSRRIRVKDNSVFDEIMEPLKEVRNLRQSPAHKIEEDRYDPDYYKQQDEIIKNVYNSLRMIRLLFANHPAAKSVNVPDWLFKGKIITY